ncbi:MAG: DUF2461 domain-containing protein [Bacteroidota bacterium]
MIQADFLQYLYELNQNNNKDWFDKNKTRYENAVKKPWEQTVAAVIERIRSFDPSIQANAKDCIHRIYRDTRFSADKTPYKNNVGAIVTRTGKKDMEYPGYYLHVEFGTLMLGGGAYFLEKESLHRVRTAIAQDPEEFRSLIDAPDFVQNFGELKGERNKVLPAEFKAIAQKEPLIAGKQFYFMAEMDPEIVLRADFAEFAAGYFKAAYELNTFLRKAILG